MTPPLDAGELFRQLSLSGVDYVLIGGMAVNAHGVIRSTKDVDICPGDAAENLQRLAAFLRDIGVRQLGVTDDGFAADEMPLDPTRADDLAQGGNFRLETPLGILDIMQWIPGIQADHAYATLASHAMVATAFDVEIRVCSLADLRTMKQAAGRPQDIQDLADLSAAHPEHPATD